MINVTISYIPGIRTHFLPAADNLFIIFSFNMLKTSDQLLTFFEGNFPDALDLIGKKDLIESYFSIKPAPLVSIKVR